jgi:hypothetical protein
MTLEPDMTTTTIKARDAQPGHSIVLDMGYGTPMDEIVTVISAAPRLNMFGDEVVALRVRRYDGEIISLVDFAPDDLITQHLPEASS